MTPRYFVGFEALEKGREYLTESGFTPLSLTTVKVVMSPRDTKPEVVPAIAAVKKEDADNMAPIFTYLVFGDQWSTLDRTEKGCEFVLLEESSPLQEEDEHHLVIPQDVGTLTWTAAA